jgi:hypothetical protein
MANWEKATLDLHIGAFRGDTIWKNERHCEEKIFKGIVGNSHRLLSWYQTNIFAKGYRLWVWDFNDLSMSLVTESSIEGIGAFWFEGKLYNWDIVSRRVIWDENPNFANLDKTIASITQENTEMTGRFYLFNAIVFNTETGEIVFNDHITSQSNDSNTVKIEVGRKVELPEGVQISDLHFHVTAVA